MKKDFVERVSGFMEGKGFYIVLFLCVAAVGISGYYLFQSSSDSGEPVGGVTSVTITPTPRPTGTPVPPATTAPLPEPSEEPRPEPIPTAAPAMEPTPVGHVFVWPVRGEVVSPYAVETLAYDETMGDWRTHSALDLAALLGTEVLVATDGVVCSVEADDLMGTTVTIDHGDGLLSTYANLAEVPTVAEGDRVRSGAVIGSVGNTAIAESRKASHLHFAMTKDGVPVDPADYLPSR